MNMRIFALLLSLSFSATAQQSSFQDPLLDRMVGDWVLTGTIDGKDTRHDIHATWVLAHQYLQFHETSIEKESNGAAAYEAMVYIGWDKAKEQYDCLWLDVTSGAGLSNGIIGHAKRSEDRIAFVFTYSKRSAFHTTFVFDKNTDTWRWIMDGEENGTMQPFARVTLQRKP